MSEGIGSANVEPQKEVQKELSNLEAVSGRIGEKVEHLRGNLSSLFHDAPPCPPDTPEDDQCLCGLASQIRATRYRLEIIDGALTDTLERLEI